jgi:hypothetical protein
MDDRYLRKNCLFGDDELNFEVGDILFQDDDVRVLRPDYPAGVVVYHSYESKNEDSIRKYGLLLGAGVKFNGRSSYRNHPFIFFRAPGENSLNISANPTIEEVDSNYMKCRCPSTVLQNPDRGIFCIRIDPYYTSVYSSEARAQINNMVSESKIPLLDYQEIIRRNKERVVPPKHMKVFNLLTYDQTEVLNPAFFRSRNFPTSMNDYGYKPYLENMFTSAPPELNGETLVSADIPPEWRVEVEL